jgi:hypothetical protein
MSISALFNHDERSGVVRELFAPSPQKKGRVDEPATTTITHVHLASVARLAVMFWSCIGMVSVLGLVGLSGFLNATGTVKQFERFVVDLTGVKEFHLFSEPVLRGAALLVLVFVVVAIALTILAAACFNALASLAGGVEVSASPKREKTSGRDKTRAPA